MKKILSLILTAAMCSIFMSHIFASEPEKSVMLYVSPNGDDSNNGSISAPFKTIERAQNAVREINGNMKGNIIVNLREGDYYLENTLEFDANDSGTNGYYVIYRAYNSENVRISGGKKVENWEQCSDKIWRAKYTYDDIVRQLYVNNRRARRAQSDKLIKTEAFFDEAGSEYAHCGIVADGTEMLKYTNAEDIQLHYVIGWKSYLLNVDGIEAYQGNKTAIRLQQPAFESAYNNNQHYIEPGIQFWAENVFEELDTEGEFYYNKAEQMLYYMPRADEDMKNADVQAAYLEVILNIEGFDANNRVRNINFEGITFANGAWRRPSVAGLVNDQAQMMALDPSDEDGVLPIVPANIRINRAEKINFRNNVIRDMGCVGIGLFNGVLNCDFSANVFCDIADSAMTVGNEFYMYDDDKYQGKDLLQNAVITASSTDGANYPIKAVNGDNFSVWSPLGNDECYLQADLGEAYEIDRIELESRENMEVDTALWGMKILASNNPDFKGSVMLASTTDGVSTDKNNTVVLKCSNPNKYRYIRFTKDYYMCLSNVRVINESMEYSPKTELCKNNSIENNYITRIGLVNFGAPGVQAYYTQNTSMSHNDIYYVPYSGLCSGWGWTLYDQTDCRDNKINYNRINECMLVAFDGGATYMLGNQPNSVQIGNYITNQRNDLAGLYLDAGSKNFTLKENVLDGVPSSYHCGMGGFNFWTDNHTTSVEDSIDFTQCINSRAERTGEIYAPGSEPLEVVEIMENAGLEPEYEYIKEKAGENYWQWSREFMLQNSEIHSGYGDAADTWYNNYYVRFNARSMLEWLPLVKVGNDVGMYPQNAVEDMKAFAQECIAISEKMPISRQEVTQTYWRIVDRIEEFRKQKNQFSAEEIILAANNELEMCNIGSGLGMTTQKNYNMLKSYIEKAQREKTDEAKMLLEAALVYFRDNKINFNISDFKVDGQIGDAVIDNENATIDVVVKYTADMKNLSAKASVNPLVNIKPNPAKKIDYSSPVQFKIKSEETGGEKLWTVRVSQEEIINSDEQYRITSAVKDTDGWNSFGSINNSIYMNERYGDITLDFDMEIAPKENDWPCLVFRSKESDLSFDSPNNEAYVMVFGENKIEFHRFNGGVRTQFYGNVPNCTAILGETFVTDAFRFGQKNNIQLTTKNTDDGVHIKVVINGETVFDFVDNYEGKITLPGYFGTVSPNAKVNITAE